MPTALPAKNLLDGSKSPATTVAEMQAAMGELRDFLADLLGSDGVPATAIAALGGLAKAGGTMTGLLKFAKGADIGSASTVNLSTATGNTAVITGTTAITALTMSTGQLMHVIFAGVLTLTHHATTNKLPGSTNITTAAGDSALYYYDGTTVQCIHYQRASGLPVVAASGTSDPYIYIRDQKAANTAGGSSSSGWNTRVLNTEVIDTGGFATLSSNQIVLAAGTYTFRARAPAQTSGAHQLRLRNVTDGTTVEVGASHYQTLVTITGDAFIVGQFTIGASKSLELQHFITSAQSTSGLGVPVNSGEVEVYAEIEFWKRS